MEIGMKISELITNDMWLLQWVSVLIIFLNIALGFRLVKRNRNPHIGDTMEIMGEKMKLINIQFSYTSGTLKFIREENQDVK